MQDNKQLFPNKLNVFSNILRLEHQLGFTDKAVLGGLDKFINNWISDLGGIDENTLTSLRAIEVFSFNYSKHTPNERSIWANEILVLIDGISNSDKKLINFSNVETTNPIKHDSNEFSDSIMYDPPAKHIKGVGVKLSNKLSDLGLNFMWDVINHFPRRHIEIQNISLISYEEEVSILGAVSNVRSVIIGARRIRSTECILTDKTGSIRVLWFNQPFLSRNLKSGSTLMISGHLRVFRHERTFEPTSNINEVVDPKNFEYKIGSLIPVYPAAAGVSQKILRNLIKDALKMLIPNLKDFLPTTTIAKFKFLQLSKAIIEIHYPTSKEKESSALKRLAFDEMFLFQLSLLYRKNEKIELGASVSISDKDHLVKNWLTNKLPFTLTLAQQKVINDIFVDMNRGNPMSRLLQGDVGSGKTVVALSSMLLCAVNGLQSALMAPTEVLAEQHFLTLNNMLSSRVNQNNNVNSFSFSLEGKTNNYSVGLLLGSHSLSEKNSMKSKIASGDIDIVVGTHSLIQESVRIPRLALAVVDEQHRFGVDQRQTLVGKGAHTHTLNMSATPIPRSLALTLYGDLDVSVINEMPKGRLPVRTRLLRPDQRKEGYVFIQSQVNLGYQAFIVCPIINESEVIQTRAAIEEHRILSEDIYPQFNVGLLHGRMNLDEKRKIMDDFRIGRIDILVATPVIEVGVDVPNANVILIEGADRFGLAELHQFRGRVGRGEAQSFCLLQADDPSAESKERLTVLEKESDGFKVSEEDLRLRGPGEFFGTRQSGLPIFQFANLNDIGLIRVARDEAGKIINDDPRLSSHENQDLRRRVESFFKDS